MERLIQERSWMYNQCVQGKSYCNEAFMLGVREFIQLAISRCGHSNGNRMRCPCRKCKNKKHHEAGVVETHLYDSGFTANYYNWTYHGEDLAHVVYNKASEVDQIPTNVSVDHQYSAYVDLPSRVIDPETVDSQFHNMIADVAGPSWDVPNNVSTLPDEPSEIARNFYNLFKSSCDPAIEGCTTETELSMHMKLLQIKTDYNLSEAAYNSICQIIQSLAGSNNRLPKSFSHSKTFVKDLDMGYTRIDVCENGCMIYYAEFESLTICTFCGASRYHTPSRASSSSNYIRVAKLSMFYLNIIPRLQRLFMMSSTAEHMSWHASRRDDNNKMVHPSDGESWKHFNRCYPDFAAETRNVRLGLCSDGFSPFRSGQSYSCWPVMVTPYNLPPWMCMKTRFMWLTILIPGPTNPKKRIDMYLRPLIDDLIVLWNVGVDTFDASRRQNFNLRAALMWTISDFPAYGMLSGWSTQGKLGCPYCMEDTKTFYLQHGRKICYFDCHRRFLPRHHAYRNNTRSFLKDRREFDNPIPFRDGHETYNRVCDFPYIWEQGLNNSIDGFGVTHNWTKKSIFWILPYWVNVKLRHNLDVMHIEKNVFENIYNTVMNVKGKTKDNGIKCRNDIALYCNRPELQLRMNRGRMVANKAKYTLDANEQVLVLQWITRLGFPDGFASRLGGYVNLKEKKLMGYKSHDAHVFLERLMSIAFRGLLPGNIWGPISELCTFFRDICGSSLHIDRMSIWKHNIIETICKLETIFPPSFFDSMEHLPIHLADEVLLGGPVHYRWMYPFERFIYRLKNSAGSRSRVEASILSAYLQLEITFLGSDYMGPEFETKARRLNRNEVLVGVEEEAAISIYNYPGRGGKIISKRRLNDSEFLKATHYILSNTAELDTYLALFDTELRSKHPDFNDDQIYVETLTNLSSWLQNHIWNLGEHSELMEWIHQLSEGFDRRVACTSTYKVNNYKFHTEHHSLGKPKKHCQVHVKGTEGDHFYGVIEEIVHMKWKGNHRMKVVLFKCRWFDPRYVVTMPENGIVEVNTTRIYQAYDPFILVQQADQVYFTDFPGQPNRTTQGWVAVCRVKPTNEIDLNVADLAFQEDVEQNSQIPIVNMFNAFEELADNVVNVYNPEDENDVPCDSAFEELDQDEGG
ncbi:unnamed protein product [Rhodiola kirilowii]